MNELNSSFFRSASFLVRFEKSLLEIFPTPIKKYHFKRAS